jgi:hypothetical protein
VVQTRLRQDQSRGAVDTLFVVSRCPSREEHGA